MSAFYLKCRCGGELGLDMDWECFLCKSCKESQGVDQTFQRYAAALGAAVEALTQIVITADEYSVSKMRIAEEALRKIKGEEK